jgi:hypothetical protein
MRLAQSMSRNDSDTEKSVFRLNFFIIFVHVIFTTLFMSLFTNVFNVIAQKPSNSCVYRMCNAD